MKMKTNEFKTKITKYNEEVASSLLTRAARKNLTKNVYVETNPAIYFLSFDTRDKDDVFRKFERDVDATIMAAKDGDLVFLSIYSPGGSAIAYGNAAQQIDRLIRAGLRVTGFVNEIAASGGYMMACVCNKIIAAPLAVVGSIGVVAEFPIFAEALQRLGVQFRTFTAGDMKRTVTPFSVPTAEQEKSFEGKLVEMHEAFREHVLRHRPQVGDSEMNGDHFLARDKVGILVDEIGDVQSALLYAVKRGVPIYRVHSEGKKASKVRSLLGIDTIVDRVVDRVFAKLMEIRFTGIQ
jgi:ClpP class serine protease